MSSWQRAASLAIILAGMGMPMVGCGGGGGGEVPEAPRAEKVDERGEPLDSMKNADSGVQKTE
jgi:hypothetical protein